MHNKLLYNKAKLFFIECYEELGRESEVQVRLQEIQQEIEQYGTYEHTFEELVHGARMAWRNSNRCIGRLFWNSLNVLDAREVNDEAGVSEALLHHIQYATNGGKIQPTITIFKPYKSEDDCLQIYNHQLIRYAGYETDHGIIGDSHSLDFTMLCEKLGWEGRHTNYDVLPLVFSLNGQDPVYKEIPANMVIEIEIEHPELPIQTLEAKWYAVPIISDMRLEIGGVTYSAAPFNGWYMGTEIGARNLADTNRYNLLPAVAELMELDTSRQASLWQDRALVELNVAVLHSFKKRGVMIVDHHTAANQFALFEKQEAACGRMVTGNWVWLIPPVSPATTHIYHQPYNNEVKTPNYFHQKLLF